MKILVTGAAGFIGSHLVEALLEQSHQITGIDNFDPFYSREIKQANLKGALDHPNFQLLELDICQSEKLMQHFKTEQYDMVVHLASKAGVRPSLERPMDYVRASVEATVSLMNAMMKTDHGKLIFASSSSIYGKNPKIPFSETHGPEYVLSAYAASKQSGEIFTRLYHNLYQFSVINLRFFTVYGPRQRPDLAIHLFLKANLLGETITLFGDGSMARDYTYIRDTLQGIQGAMGKMEGVETPLYETYNLGNHTPVTLKELIAAIEEVCDRKCRIEYRDIPPGDVPITYADITKAQKDLKYSPQTPLREGLEEMYSWIKSLY